MLKTCFTIIFFLINNKTKNYCSSFPCIQVTRVLTLYFAMAIHHVTKTINAILLDNSTVFKSYLTLLCAFINLVA